MKHTQKYFVKLLEALITNFRDVLVSSGGIETLTRPTVSKRKGEERLTENFWKTVFRERNTVSGPQNWWFLHFGSIVVAPYESTLVHHVHSEEQAPY